VRRAETRGEDALALAGWTGIAVAFTALAIWVRPYYIAPKVDLGPSDWIYDHRLIWPFTAGVWHALGTMGLARVLGSVAVVAAALLLWRGWWVESALVAGALPAAVAHNVVRSVIARSEGDYPTDPPVRPYPFDPSFPSGHAFGEFVVFGLVALFASHIIGWRPGVIAVRVACVVLIALGGLERVADGRHWPTDIVGAHLLAALYVIPAAWLSARFGSAVREQPAEESAPVSPRGG
jgi:membrane-associated phospholipid phosphatase